MDHLLLNCDLVQGMREASFSSFSSFFFPVVWLLVADAEEDLRSFSCPEVGNGVEEREDDGAFPFWLSSSVFGRKGMQDVLMEDLPHCFPIAGCGGKGSVFGGLLDFGSPSF